MQSNGNPAATAALPAGHSTAVPRTNPRFLSVTAVAKALGMSEATMYRAVRAGEFPAVRVRGRYVIPVRALDALEDAALTCGATVDAADWVDPDTGLPVQLGDRGSIPVWPLVGFAAFLVIANLAMTASAVALAAVTLVAVVSVIGVVLRTLRRDSVVNKAGEELMQSSWTADFAAGRSANDVSVGR